MTGKYMTQFDFIDLAAQGGLELIETTSERNGYPRCLKKAIIGFDSMEEAREYAEQHNLSIEIFHKRDGWSLWYRTGNRAYDPFIRTAEDYGDTICCLQPMMPIIIMRTKCRKSYQILTTSMM